MEKLTLTYLKKEFYLDGFLEMLKKKEIKKFNNLNYIILTVCSFGIKNYDTLIEQLYDEKSNSYITWDELRRSGELIPKLSNNFKLSYQKREGFGQHEFNTVFLTCHILKSKIDKLYYLTSYFIDLDDSNYVPEYSILNSFKTLKDAKKSSSIILKKFKTKGIYPSTLG
jgi:hypothetical protein